MPLTIEQSRKLYDVIQNGAASACNKIKNPLLIDTKTKSLFAEHRPDADSIDTILIDARRAILDRKSTVVNVSIYNTENKVRVYPHSDTNIEVDVVDIYGRGLDALRAVNEILRYQKSGNSYQAVGGRLGCISAHKQSMDLLQKFQENMNEHKASGEQGKKNALLELKRFNGALSDLLLQTGMVSSHSQANAAINFVRDFLWKKDIGNIAHCVVEGQPATMLRFAEPMTFENQNQSSISGSNNPWGSGKVPRDKAWYRKLASEVGSTREGAWLDNFFEQRRTSLRELSSTPMSRYTPNPANAFDCTDIIIQHDTEKGAWVSHVSHHDRVAITEPLNVGETNSRQEVTNWNHSRLLDEKKLEAKLNVFMEHWGSLYTDGSIPFTMLHQTLIADEVSLMPDQRKAKRSLAGQGNVIDSKIEANSALRKALAGKAIYRNKQDGTIVICDEGTIEREYQYQRVHLKLLETNNCINMWSSVSRIRNRDINDSRALIKQSVALLSKVSEKNGVKETKLETIIEFLNSSDHSFFSPYKFRGEKVKQAVEALTKELTKRDERFYGLEMTPQARENLALSIQAAVELKCTVHETWGGSMRRTISNFTRDNLRKPYFLGVGHLIDWTVRGSMGGVAFIGRMVNSMLSPQHVLKHQSYRKEIFKSTYEGLLAESLGSLQGGCMSSADRAGEMAEQRAAMKKQFSRERKILSYNDLPKTKYDVFKRYGRTKAKHDFVEMATGTPVTSDAETRGYASRDGVFSHNVETIQEQKMANDFRGMRKGKFEDDITYKSYLKSTPVGRTLSPVKRLLKTILPSKDYVAFCTKQNTNQYTKVGDDCRKIPEASHIHEDESEKRGILPAFNVFGILTFINEVGFNFLDLMVV